MNCWKCKKNLDECSLTIGFRATCPYCDIDLHCCKNCRFYAPGKPNDCRVLGTDYIRDREAANFCEEFKACIDSTPSDSNNKQSQKKRFDSLFKNED